MTEIYIAKTTPLEDARLFGALLDTVRPERRARIERLRLASDRRRSLCAELLLAHALRLRGITEYSVSYGMHGKPYLNGCDGLFFNLSHAGEYAVCAISDGEVGCDVERIDPHVNLAIADRFFTPDEAAWIRAGECEAEAVERFFRLWTLKESLMKATGKGFALSPRAFAFFMDGQTPVLQNPSQELCHYVFFETSVTDGYRLAVCASGTSVRAELFPKEIETLC